MDLAELQKSDNEIMDRLFELIKTETPSDQRQIVLDYIQVRHEIILQWASESWRM